MKLFLDTNVIIASLTDEQGLADAATAVLDLTEIEGVRLFTSLVNLMELRTALAKNWTLSTTPSERSPPTSVSPSPMLRICFERSTSRMRR